MHLVCNQRCGLVLTSNPDGTGSDKISFEIRENFTFSARSGALKIAGLTYTIVQDGGLGEDCNFAISPSAVVYTSNGGNGTINVFCEPSCAWQAVSNVGWVTITSGDVGTGNGMVSYHVGANPGPGGRSATITVAGVTFRIKQKS